MSKLALDKLVQMWSSCHIFIAESVLAMLRSSQEHSQHENILEACVQIAKAMLEMEGIGDASDLIEELEKSVRRFIVKIHCENHEVLLAGFSST